MAVFAFVLPSERLRSDDRAQLPSNPGGSEFELPAVWEHIIFGGDWSVGADHDRDNGRRVALHEVHPGEAMNAWYVFKTVRNDESGDEYKCALDRERWRCIDPGHHDAWVSALNAKKPVPNYMVMWSEERKAYAVIHARTVNGISEADAIGIAQSAIATSRVEQISPVTFTSGEDSRLGVWIRAPHGTRGSGEVISRRGASSQTDSVDGGAVPRPFADARSGVWEVAREERERKMKAAWPNRA